MKLQIVQLEPFDDPVSVRERLAFLTAERVLLLWPERGAILRRKLDLVLVLRAAANANARLALVTPDPLVQDNAAALNISVFTTVEAAQAGRWKKPRAKLFSAEAPAARDRRELAERGSRLRRNALSAEQQRQQRIVRGVVLLVLFVTVIAFSVIVLPGARVTVFLARDQLTTTVRLVADPTIAIENVATGHIPARLVGNLIVERQASIRTSGSADVPATLASGTVILTNQTTDAVSIPRGTIVTTFAARPARFQTMQDVLINARGTAEVTITAASDSAGPVGNIEANLISRVEGDLNGKLSVRNPAPTQGGTVRQQGIVTKSDQDKLLALLRDQIRTSAVADIALSPTQFIAPGSIQVIEERPEWTTFSNFAGDQADSLSLTLKVRVQALVIDEVPARKVAYASLAKLLVDRRVVVESVRYQRGKVEPVDAKGMAALLITVSGDAVNDADAEALRNHLAGMSVPDANAYLDRAALLDPRRPPQFEVWPGVFGRLPLLPVRIELQVQ